MIQNAPETNAEAPPAAVAEEQVPADRQTLLDQHGTDARLDSGVRIAQYRRRRLAGTIHDWSGLLAAGIVVGLGGHAGIRVWMVALCTGLLVRALLPVVRQQSRDGFGVELLVGGALCAMVVLLPLLCTLLGVHDVRLVYASVAFGSIVLFLVTLPLTHRAAIVANRSLFVAIPPLATALQAF